MGRCGEAARNAIPGLAMGATNYSEVECEHEGEAPEVEWRGAGGLKVRGCLCGYVSFFII